MNFEFLKENFPKTPLKNVSISKKSFEKVFALAKNSLEKVFK